MSTTVDERVVEMRFDNRHFENNVRTTLSTLDKLKASLNLSGAAKGLENIENISRKITLSGLNGAIETVNARFSALEVIGITALSRITNSAIDAGKRIASSLTVDPIKLGYQEYETQINAVQTILANTSSKGKTIKDVNAALDELNTYADKTIYNFTEMTRNIGTFTAAGVDLDTSVQAIKGIANLAAVSGSTSQQASTAMYQLSQALASGTVKLQDWNSVVNAGMGGQVFQDSLMETARVHGVAIDRMVKQEGSFRETLKNGWLTSEVLTETLAKFTGDLNKEQLKTMGYTEDQIKEILKLGQTANDAATKVKTFTQLFDTLQEAAQSGWTQSWEIIVGDFEEAKALLTEVSDVFSAIIGKSADARNSMLEGWADLGGRTALIEAFRNAFAGISSVIKPVKEGFREIFPPTTSKQLYEMTKALENFTSHLKLNDTQSKNLKNTFKGLFAILDIGKQAFSAIFKNISPLVGKMTGLGDGLLGVTGSMGEWLVNLDETIKKTDVFNKTIQNVVNVVKNMSQKVSEVVGKTKTKFDEFISGLNIDIKLPGLETFHNILARIHIRMGQLSEASSKVGENIKKAFVGGSATASIGVLSKGLDGAVSIFSTFWNVLKTIGSEISKVCSKIGESIGNAFNGADFDKIFDVVNGGLFAGLLISLQQFVGGFSGLGDVTEGVTDILDNVRGCFEAYQQNLQAKTLLTIAGAIAILAGSIMLISTIDSAKLTSSLGAVTVLFADLLGSLAVFSRMSGNLKGVTKAVGSMVALSVAIAILASSLKKIAELDMEQLGVGLSGIAGLTATVVLAAKAMSKDTGKVMKGATNLIMFAAAIKILASACKDLSTLSWDEMARGLTGVGILMAEVSLFLNTAKFSGKAMTTATGMVILASAIKVLASACGDFASLSWDEISKGLVSIGVLLAELAAFTNLTGNAKKLVSTGTSMVLLGASMKIFASAMSDFGNMSWEEIARGLTAMAGALAEITISMNLMPKNMVGTGTGLIAVSAALVILANALQTMGSMSLEEIGKGIVALGSSILILAIGLNMMNGTLAGSAAMVIAAGALAMMVPTLSILGAMSWESIAKGLVALAGAFTVVGVAGLLLTPVIPSILGLGGAFALIGVGVLGIGAGLAAAGAGLAALAAGLVSLVGVGAAGATAIVGSLTIIITGIANMIPTVIGKIGEGIVTLLQVLANSAPEFCKAAITIVTAVIDALVATVPKMVQGTFALIKAILETIAQYAPSIIQTALDILISFLEVIANNIGRVVSTAVDVVIAFIGGIASKLPDIIQAGFDLLIAFINGMADAIEKNAPILVQAIMNLMMSILKAGVEVLKGGIGLIKQVGSDIIHSGFIQGIKGKIGNILTCLGEMLINMKDKIEDKISDFKEVGVNVIQGFIDGILSKMTGAIDAVKSLGKNVIDTATSVFDIHSPSKVFRNEIGKRLGEGMILGIKDIAPAVSKETSNMSKKSIEAAKSEFDAFKSWLSDKKYFNEITLEDELYAWEEARKRYANYADQRKEADKEIYRLKKELETKQFNDSKQWISDRKYYDQMSAEQELQAWERLQSKYLEGTDQRKEADKEVYRLKKELESNQFNESKQWISDRKYFNELTTEQELEAWERIQNKYLEGTEQRKEADKEVYSLKNKLMQEQYSNSKQWISDQKFFDKMTLKQELQAWKDLQAQYEEGSEQRKEADREVYQLQKQWNSKLEEYENNRISINKKYNEQRIRLEEEYADKVQSINEKLASDIESLQSQYESSIKSRADSIYNSFSLFEGVKIGEEVDSSTLMTNLEDQVDALNDWRSNLDKLSGRGVSDEFMEEITKMGPSASKQIEALNSMSSDELSKYVDLWEEKHRIATEQSTQELEGLRLETKAKIEQLKIDADIELNDYREVWNEQMETLKQDTLSQLEEIKNDWVSTVGELSDVITTNDISTDSYENTGKEVVSSLVSGMESGTPEVKTGAQEISDTALKTINENTNEYQNTGSMIVDGLVKGLMDNRYKIVAAMNQIAEELLYTIRETLDIHSPSRVMQTIGQYVGLGFINGINEYANKAGKAGSDIGNSAKDGLADAISQITSIMNSDLDDQPIIRPVLDLSQVEKQAGDLNSMLSRSHAISISESLRKDSTELQNGTKEASSSPVYQFTQNNYSPKALSRIEIYRQTKNQFTAMKGVLV